MDDQKVEGMKEEKEWLLILLMLLQKTNKLWRDFEKEIKYNNRFFPKGELLDELRRIQKYAVYEIKKGKRFYRARLFAHPYEYYQKELKQITDTITKYYPNIKNRAVPFDLSDVSDITFLFGAMSCLDIDNQPLCDELEKIFQKKKRFWGYGAEQSDAPPKEKTSGGRANPSNISYLYIAEDVKTAILEVRPNVTQEVSVATVKITKDLKLFDFCYTDPNESELGRSLDLGIISAAFSMPNFGDENNYYATQYVCEFIKEMGFDGIRFYSSLNPEGKNIVLFDIDIDPLTKCKNYKIINSKVYSITKLGIDFQQVMPLEQK